MNNFKNIFLQALLTALLIPAFMLLMYTGGTTFFSSNVNMVPDASAASGAPQQKCSDPVIVGAANDDWYSASYGNQSMPLSVYFEPDIAGAGTLGEIKVQSCMVDAVTASCRDLEYDSDGNGVPDTAILTGDSTQRSGIAGIAGIPFIRITTSTSPAANPTEAPRYVVCRGL